MAVMDLVLLAALAGGAYYFLVYLPEQEAQAGGTGETGGTGQTLYEDVYDQDQTSMDTGGEMGGAGGDTYGTGDTGIVPVDYPTDSGLGGDPTEAIGDLQEAFGNDSDSQECQNYLQSGEPVGFPCTNECSATGTADDCLACESACGQKYPHEYEPVKVLKTDETDCKRNNAANTWNAAGKCCSCPGRNCYNECPSSSSTPTPAKKSSGGGGGGLGIPTKAPMTAKPPKRNPPPKPGPITPAKKNAAKKIKQCKGLTGATKTACEASYARAYYIAESRGGPSYTGRDVFGQSQSWFPEPDFRNQSLRYPFHQGPGNPQRMEMQRRFARSKKYGSVTSPVELKRFQIANDQYYP